MQSKQFFAQAANRPTAQPLPIRTGFPWNFVSWLQEFCHISAPFLFQDFIDDFAQVMDTNWRIWCQSHSLSSHGKAKPVDQGDCSKHHSSRFRCHLAKFRKQGLVPADVFTLSEDVLKFAMVWSHQIQVNGYEIVTFVLMIATNLSVVVQFVQKVFGANMSFLWAPSIYARTKHTCLSHTTQTQFHISCTWHKQ